MEHLMLTAFAFVLWIATVRNPTEGFVFSGDSSATLSPNSADDIRYLHLLLADEKYERLRQQNEIDQLKGALQNVLEQLELAKAGTCGSCHTPNVAFRVQLMTDIGQVHKGHVIVYDHVDLNMGNAYDVRHGIFKAPYNGTYTFSITLGNIAHAGHIYLKKNSQTIEFAWAGYNANWEMGGVSTVAVLYAGDDVWVEGEGYVGGGFSDHLHTGFSGVLINTF